MADAPTSFDLSPALRKAVEDCARPDVPLTIAAMRVLMESAHEGEAEAAVARACTTADGRAGERMRHVLDLLRRNPSAWHTVRGVLAGMDHSGHARSAEEGVAYWAEVFDKAARISPEASVALYSLGSPDLLRAATAEVVELLRRWRLLGKDRRVLDLGCGIGRFAEALAPEVADIVGIDVSAEMIRLAKSRLAHLPNVSFAQANGRDLSAFANESFGLVLAADVFPYLVQAGLALAETHIRESARVLRPGGSLFVLNFSYRGDLQSDDAELARFASAAGLTMTRASDANLSLWDGAVFHLRKGE